MNIKLKSILLIGAWLWGAPACAEILILKSGKRVEGKVIERRENAIKLMVNGIPSLYFMDEIERVIKESGQLPYQDLYDKQPLPITEIPPTKVQLIRKLMEYNGAKLNIEKVFQELVKKAPPEKAAYYQMLFQVDEMVNLVIPIYEKYYTEQELEEMITFYSSPTGQKLIEITPITIQESLKATIAYFQEKTAEDK